MSEIKDAKIQFILDGDELSLEKKQYSGKEIGDHIDKLFYMIESNPSVKVIELIIKVESKEDAE